LPVRRILAQLGIPRSCRYQKFRLDRNLSSGRDGCRIEARR
jgi:hypothetical protein